MPWYPIFNRIICIKSIWNSNFAMLQSLSRYNFNINIYVNNMLTEFHVRHIFLTFLKPLVLINQNVKYTIIMFHCKTYLDTD